MLSATQPALSIDAFFAVQQFNAEYGRSIDEDELERWPTFFLESATYEIVPRENVDGSFPIALIYCKNRAMMEDRVLAIRQASVFGPHRYRHVIGVSSVQQSDEGLSCRTSFAVFQVRLDPVDYGTGEVYAFGEYRDEFVFGGEHLLLRSRRVILDTSRVPTLLVTPL